MDDFRKFQKYGFGGPGNGRSGKNRRIYGCPCCCRYNVCLRAAKIIARKRAKGKFRTETAKQIRAGIQEHHSFQEDY